jgi:hypothetical protein
VPFRTGKLIAKRWAKIFLIFLKKTLDSTLRGVLYYDGENKKQNQEVNDDFIQPI